METNIAYRPLTCMYCGQLIKTGHPYVRRNKGRAHAHPECIELVNAYGCINQKEVLQTVVDNYPWGDTPVSIADAITYCAQQAGTNNLDLF